MIRKILHMIVLGTVMLSVSGVPMLVEADIFLRPNDKAAEASEKKAPKKRGFSSFFLRPNSDKAKKSATSKSSEKAQPNTFFKRRSGTVVVNNTREKQGADAERVDVAVLGPGGRDPQNARELAMLAESLKKPKLAALRKYKSEHSAAVARVSSQQRRSVRKKPTPVKVYNPNVAYRRAPVRDSGHSVSKSALRSQPQERKKKTYIGRKRTTTDSSTVIKKPRRVFNRYERSSE